MLPKCPFFNQPCVENKCTAFESYKRYLYGDDAENDYPNKVFYVDEENRKYFIRKICHAFQRELELPEIKE